MPLGYMLLLTLCIAESICYIMTAFNKLKVYLFKNDHFTHIAFISFISEHFTSQPKDYIGTKITL